MTMIRGHTGRTAAPGTGSPLGSPLKVVITTIAMTVFLVAAAPDQGAADPGSGPVPVSHPRMGTADELYRVVPAHHPAPAPLRVRVWTDRGSGGVYYPGERVRIRFTANDDAYVCIYNIDTSGEVRVLFPAPGDPGLVYAHEVVTLPHPHADFDYMVSGPPGIETIEAVASRAPLEPWDDAWRDADEWWYDDDDDYDEYDDGDDYDDDGGDYEYWDESDGWYEDDVDWDDAGWEDSHRLDGRPLGPPRATGYLVSGDPFVAIHRVNGRLLPYRCDRRDHDTAYISFYVGRRVPYPRYACNDCHGSYHRFDPYADRCSVFSIRVNVGWVYPTHHVYVRHYPRVLKPRYVYVRHRRVPKAYRNLKMKWPSHEPNKLRKQFYGTPAWKLAPKGKAHPSSPPIKWKGQEPYRAKEPDGYRPKAPDRYRPKREAVLERETKPRGTKARETKPRETEARQNKPQRAAERQKVWSGAGKAVDRRSAAATVKSAPAAPPKEKARSMPREKAKSSGGKAGTKSKGGGKSKTGVAAAKWK